MDGYLRQSTASQARLIGPFLDDTDFKTAETALSIANTDVILRANGTTLSNKNSGGGTHQSSGMYSLTWDATDTANVGELKYVVKVAGALPVFGSYVVLEEAVYDALFAAAAPGYVANAPVNVAQYGGVNGTFSGGRPEVNTSHFGGTALTQSGGRPEVNTTHAAGTAWNSGAIGPNTLAADTITAAKVAADVTTELQSGLATSAALAAVQADTDDLQTRIPAVLVGGRMDASVGAMASNVLTAAAIAADAITAAKIAADAIGASELAADAVSEIVAAVFARVFPAAHGGFTFEQLIGIIGAASAAKLSGGATTTITIRNLGDTANIIVATVDENGNRTAVTVTP